MGGWLQSNIVRSSCFDPVALTTGQNYDVVEMVVVCVSGLHAGVDIVNTYVSLSEFVHVQYVHAYCTYMHSMCVCVVHCTSGDIIKGLLVTFSLFPAGRLFPCASCTEGRWLLFVSVVRRPTQALEVRPSIDACEVRTKGYSTILVRESTSHFVYQCAFEPVRN